VNRFAALLSAAAILAAPAAQAEDLYASFQSLCVGTHGQAAPSLAVAASAGWMPMPDSLVQQFAGGSEFKDVQGRIRSSSSSMEIMLIARMEGKIRQLPVRLQICAVASMPPDAAVSAKLTDWVAVPSSDELSEGARTGYVFTDEAGQHHAISSDRAEALKLIRGGRLVVAAIQQDKQMSMAMYAIPSISESP